MRVVVLTSLLVGCGFAPKARDVQPDAQSPNGGPTIPLSSCHSQQPDLRLCLDFEDPSLDPVIQDLSAGNHNAWTTLVAPWRRDGQQAAAMDLGSTISILEAPDLDIAQNLTIEMWINPDSDTDAYPLTNSGQYTLGIQQHALYCQFGSHGVHANATIEVDTWTHVACTYDGTTVTAYLDGDVSACRTSPLDSIPNVNASGTKVGVAYSGAIDDVHIYARTLDAPQIQSLAGVTSGTTACSGKDD